MQRSRLGTLGIFNERRITKRGRLSNEYQQFVNGYLNANTWPERKDGPPFYLLDSLNREDRIKAEKELIERLNLGGDSWPIAGLGYLKSEKALNSLYDLLSNSEGIIRAEIATAIWNISGDEEMLKVVIQCSMFERLKQSSPYRQYLMIDVIYCLSQFGHPDAIDRLTQLSSDPEYLISYNAKRALDRMSNVR